LSERWVSVIVLAAWLAAVSVAAAWSVLSMRLE